MRETDSLCSLLLSSQRAVSAPVCPAAGICSSEAFSVRLGLGHTTPERVESASLLAKTSIRTLRLTPTSIAFALYNPHREQ